MELSPLSTLQPASLWYHFDQICNIPRPSKHEQRLVTHILSCASAKGLEAFTDKAGNVIIRKPASPGRERAAGIVMQSHLDMVPQKTDQSTHDFFNDPIKTVIDGEWVTADGTTLGADNGIGVAAILAVMFADDTSDHIEHGPLEALLTVDEEAGMSGAANLEPGILQGRQLLNLDTEEDGELYVGCAGGIDVNISLPLEWQPVNDDSVALNLSVKGLKGGHSGIDIHKARGNALKLATRIALESRDEFPSLRISRFDGGTLRNAIPRNSELTIVLPASQKADFEDYVNALALLFCSELSQAKDSVAIDIEQANTPKSCLTEACQSRLLNTLYECPNGVIKMSDTFEGVVETSNNVAIIALDEQQAHIQCLVRSSINEERDKACELIRSAFAEAQAKIITDNGYPGWKPNPASTLLATMQTIHQKTLGAEAKVQVIHAGLECGLLGEKYPEWDMISFGPTIRGAHSPDERVHIKSVGTFWVYLLASLDALSRP